MPRRTYPAGTVTNTTGAALRLTFHATSTTGHRETDLWTIDGSGNLVERIPNGVILTTASGAYSAFAGPDDIDILYVGANGGSRSLLTATGTVPTGTSVDNNTYARKQAWQGRLTRSGGRVFPTMTSPPTIAALTTTSGITTKTQYFSLSTNGSTSIVTYPQDYWTYLGCGSPTIYGTGSPDFNYVKFQSFSTPTGSSTGAYGLEFYHYGTTVEFMFKGLAGNYQILVDDELVQATPFAVSNTGSTYFQLITFGAAAVRKIRFLAMNLPFGGVNVGATDTIWPTEKRGPRVAFLGDSYTNGTASVAGCLTSWASYGSETLGWYDRYHAYAGGSGYIQAGAGVGNFAARVASDVIANNPDIVVVAGGHNDTASPTAIIGAAAASLYASVKAGLPNAALIVMSPFWGISPEGIGASMPLYYDQRDAIKAAALAAGALFLDFMEVPLTRTPKSGTLSAATLAGATSWKTQTLHPATQSFVEVGTGATRDRQRVTAESFASSTWTNTVKGLVNAHASGDPWVEVGQPFVFGSGNIGATTGDGNADIFTAADNIHWSDAGHQAAGRMFAALVTQALGY